MISALAWRPICFNVLESGWAGMSTWATVTDWAIASLVCVIAIAATPRHNAARNESRFDLFPVIVTPWALSAGHFQSRRAHNVGQIRIRTNLPDLFVICDGGV